MDKLEVFKMLAGSEKKLVSERAATLFARAIVEDYYGDIFEIVSEEHRLIEDKIEIIFRNNKKYDHEDARSSNYVKIHISLDTGEITEIKFVI